jgi:flagellar biosynthesis protein FliR
MIPVNDLDALFGLMMVFLRCGSALFASPLFGAQNTPLQVRIYTSMALSFALSFVVKHQLGHVPDGMGAMVMAVANEIACGILIGMMLQWVLQIATVAGSFIDMQIGLGMSQSLNPMLGVPVTLISQYKTMLGMVIFLSIDGHQWVIKALVHSYDVAPTLTASDLGVLMNNVPALLTQFMMLSIQIAAPVLGVSLIIDAALGMMSKSLPQLQPIQIGMPAKLGLGIASISLCLPALVSAISVGVERSMGVLAKLFGS